jgi:hypothetical protein
MLQFNLPSPEWTGIIKQNLSYDCEPVSSVGVVTHWTAGIYGSILDADRFFSFSLFVGRPSFLFNEYRALFSQRQSGTGVWFTVVGYGQLIIFRVRKRARMMGYTAIPRSLCPCLVANYQSATTLTSTYYRWSSTSSSLTRLLTFYLMMGSGTEIMLIVFSENLIIVDPRVTTGLTYEQLRLRPKF